MSFHLPSLSSDLTPWIDPVLSPQRFTLFSSLYNYNLVHFSLVTRIAYLGLRDVDPPEQAVLESLGIASYYTQVLDTCLHAKIQCFDCSGPG